MENKSLNKYRYTIIIPHYKIINLLGRALQSIPDREDIQILVVDDNSGIERCEFEKFNKFEKAHCQFVLLKENRGAGVARNEALKKTEGQWLFFLDADDFFEEKFHNYIVVSIALILYGLLFIIIEKKNKNSTAKIESIAQITYKTALYIGLFQALSLIPGTSRSGSTILGAIIIGVSRVAAAEFSFYFVRHK